MRNIRSRQSLLWLGQHSPSDSFILSVLSLPTICQLTGVSTTDLGQHPASLAAQAELERGQPTVLVVHPEPGTASGRPFSPSAQSESQQDTDSLC